jgi:hypothetical protein
MIWWEDFRVGDTTEMGRHTCAVGMEGWGLFGRKN